MNSNDVIESSILDVPDESESVFCYCAWGKKRKKGLVEVGLRYSLCLQGNGFLRKFKKY